MTSQTMEKESLISVKRIASSSAATSSLTGTSTNSPGHHLTDEPSQIDHIIINSKWRSSLQDVWVMRNADVSSNHNLLVAKMTLKQRNAKIRTARNQRLDISKLKDTHIKEKFNITLNNCFSIHQDEMAMTIDDFNTAMMESAKETIGYTNTCKSEWVCPDTSRKIEDRR